MACLSLFLCALTVSTQQVEAASPSFEQLKQYVAELQKNPGDQELRENIITLALELKPPPAIPEEAERRLARGGKQNLNPYNFLLVVFLFFL